MQHETKMENQSWLKKLARRLGPGHVVNLCFIVVLLFSTLLTWREVVVLEDAAGRSWRLCGVADPAVKAGDIVTAGQKLGTVGTVGCECAEESHIHVEVKQGESYLDPAKLPE